MARWQVHRKAKGTLNILWPFGSRPCEPWWVLLSAYQQAGDLAQGAELVPEKEEFGQSTNNPGNATGGDLQGAGETWRPQGGEGPAFAGGLL